MMMWGVSGVIVVSLSRVRVRVCMCVLFRKKCKRRHNSLIYQSNSVYKRL